jgi:hypothetical protein
MFAVDVGRFFGAFLVQRPWLIHAYLDLFFAWSQVAGVAICECDMYICCCWRGLFYNPIYAIIHPRHLVHFTPRGRLSILLMHYSCMHVMYVPHKDSATVQFSRDHPSLSLNSQRRRQLLQRQFTCKSLTDLVQWTQWWYVCAHTCIVTGRDMYHHFEKLKAHENLPSKKLGEAAN